MSQAERIMLVFGTRPEAIKMAPLVHALKSEPTFFDTTVCVTGQHREMLDQVLQTFDIIPDIDLDLMDRNQNLFDITSSVLRSMHDVFNQFQPNKVIVHGDTTTAMSTALAAFYSKLPIGHVEAGLRTYDLESPFPEELNRQMVSKTAKWHFAPTELSRQNLIDEGIAKPNIVVTGNTVIDALQWVLQQINERPALRSQLVSYLSQNLDFEWQNKRFILITGHRRENFGEGLSEICNSIKKLAVLHTDVHFVYPVHLNPIVQKQVYSILSGLPNVHLIGPLSYQPFVYLLQYCYLVLTDSGGIQEEAPSLGKPVLVTRETTERTEAVDAGTVRLVGTNYHRIIEAISSLLENTEDYQMISHATNPYGDGNACIRIVNFLKEM